MNKKVQLTDMELNQAAGSGVNEASMRNFNPVVLIPYVPDWPLPNKPQPIKPAPNPFADK